MTEQPDSVKLDHLIDMALAEDIGPGDITTEAVVSSDRKARGIFVAHQEGVISGLITIEPLFRKIDPTAKVELLAKDGDRVKPDQPLAQVFAHARAVLSGERIALNFMQRMSGVASYARKCVDSMGETKVKILDTRKTTPGWRQLEKYAARCGGATNHRIGLYDMVLIKENHQEISHKNIREAIASAREAIPAGVMIEIEVHELDDDPDAVEAGADVIMLDNMTRSQISRGAAIIREAAQRQGRRVIIEISGGIKLKTLAQYGQLDIDWISLGAITHSAPALDISLDIEALD